MKVEFVRTVEFPWRIEEQVIKIEKGSLSRSGNKGRINFVGARI